MPTYVYETIPAKPTQVSRRFEVKQSMNDAPLTRDPESGLPVRRVISGGFAPVMSGSGSEAGGVAAAASPRHGCGSACGCVGN